MEKRDNDNTNTLQISAVDGLNGFKGWVKHASCFKCVLMRLKHSLVVVLNNFNGVYRMLNFSVQKFVFNGFNRLQSLSVL